MSRFYKNMKEIKNQVFKQEFPKCLLLLINWQSDVIL